MNRAPLYDRQSYSAWQQIGTRWADNDMYGHVNNVIYYAWFDTVVNRWLIDSGLPALEGGPLIGLWSRVVADMPARWPIRMP